MKRDHWQDWVNALAGVWVFGSPWLLEHSMVVPDAAIIGMWDLWLVGLVMIVIAMMAVYAFRTWEEWSIFALGAWLLASPWVLGFSASTALMWTSVIAGTLVVVLASWVLVGEKLHISS